MVVDSFFSKISGLLNKGNERSIRAKKNIAAMFFVKGGNIIIGLITVPLVINYLNSTKYGIWITLTSLVAWIGFFDIGLGNGMRNKFAEAMAKNNHQLARTYVSTTYALLGIIISVIFILFISLNPFISWNKILNADVSYISSIELTLVAIIVFSSFCFTFVLNLITTVLNASQQNAKASLIDLTSKSISLLVIFILTRYNDGSLLYLALAYCFITPLVLFCASLFFFNSSFKNFKPSFKYIDFSKSKDLLNLGIKFFFIQIAVIILYQTNNIIISQLFGPAEVTPYNIAFKYFNALLMVFTIIISPLWSAFTEAWTKQDTVWIKNTMNKLIKLWFISIAAGLLMLLVSGYVYKVWIGEGVIIPFSISLLVLLWNLLNMWNGIYSYFLNGVGKIKIQIYLGVSAAIINIPLAVLLGKWYGINGLLTANILVLIFGSVLVYIQYKKIITFKASGIWNK